MDGVWCEGKERSPEGRMSVTLCVVRRHRNHSERSHSSVKRKFTAPTLRPSFFFFLVILSDVLARFYFIFLRVIMLCSSLST